MKGLNLFLLFIVIPNILFGQSIKDYEEKTAVITDRTLYTSGENIFFSAYIINEELKNLAVSNIMYIEIITPWGEQINGAKYKIEDNKCSGFISIPENIISGYYYIRAYTKYMRRRGPKAYAYLMVKIFNPGSKHINKSAKTIIEDCKLLNNVFENNNVLVTVNKKVFSAREQGVLNINKYSMDSLANCIILITPENAFEPKTVIFSNQFGEYNNATNNFQSLKPLMSAVISSIPKDTVFSNIEINLFLSENESDSSLTVGKQAKELTFNYPRNNKGNIDYYTSYQEADSILHLNFKIDKEYLNNFLKTSKLNFESNFLPESDGITLGGFLKQKNSDSKFSKDIINLTILNKKKNIFYPFQKDTSIYFYYDFADIYGNHDVFISASNSDTENNILIENDFCTKAINLPNPEFTLSQKEKNLVYSFAINNKVQDYFNQSNLSVIKNDDGLNNDTIPFYGKPDIMIHVKDYIRLPKLEDYFSELLSLDVRFKNIRDKKKVKIIGDRPEMEIYDPLVMIDYVPINNVNDILNLKPDNIYRIDVVKDPYLKGNVIYGGILNVLSNKNDFAGIKLPESGIFLNYKFLSNNSNYNLKDTFPNHVPDSRNTIYWEPDLNFEVENKKQITFYTSDMTGIFEIHVIAITDNGKFIETVKRFEVK